MTPFSLSRLLRFRRCGRRRPDRLLALLTAAAATLCLCVVGGTAYAHAQPRALPLSPAARAAGLQPGNATMGWYQRSRAGRLMTANRVAERAQTPSLWSGAVLGIDVASYQGYVNWASWASVGKRFAYVKATEGTSYRNPYFSSQFNGSRAAGLMHGAYHFANPAGRSGTAQADYFVANGGRWVRDGHTLPGVLDIEYNPYGSTCYGLSQAAMVSWIRAFVTEYKRLTTRDAVIYSTTDWWLRCTSNTTAFSRTNPLWIARYSSTVGTLPGSWPYYTFWQYAATYIDSDVFSGAYSRLQVLATNAA